MEAIPDLQELALETVRSPRLRLSSHCCHGCIIFFANKNAQVRDHGLEMTFEQKGLANFRFFGGKLPRAYLTSVGIGCAM